MVYFQNKNPNLGKFGRVLQWKILVYFMAIWCILRQFGMFYGHSVHMVIWYTFPRFGMYVAQKENLATLLLNYMHITYSELASFKLEID
jgi:glycyl-tRNA synthetase alpha subunit